MRDPSSRTVSVHQTPARNPAKRLALYLWGIVLTLGMIYKDCMAATARLMMARNRHAFLADLHTTANAVRDDRGFIEGPVLALLGGILTMIFAVIGLVMASSLLPTYISAGANASKAIGTADFGNSQVNQMRAPFQILMAVLILIGAVFTVLAFILIRI